MASILVTGGSGFLGINLIRFLLKRGHRVRSLDFAPFDYPEKNQIEVVLGDIRDQALLEKSVQGMHLVVHCAAALPLYSPSDIFTIDRDGTRNVLESAFRHGVERVVHISSTAVYGIPDHHPLLETDPLRGVGPYGQAKIMAEEICLQYRKKGFCIPILRPVSFIGPERLGIFALFFDWAKEGRNFPILGNGANRYQFLDVEDFCEVIHLCLTRDHALVNDTFNVGALEFTTMKEDYQTVLDRAGFGKKIIGFPAAPVIVFLRLLELLHLSPLYRWIYESAAQDSFASVEKAQKQLNWRPCYSNQAALLRNYEWYLAHEREFKDRSGISHRVPWRQGALKWLKCFF